MNLLLCENRRYLRQHCELDAGGRPANGLLQANDRETEDGADRSVVTYLFCEVQALFTRLTSPTE